jgi:ABC-type nitrate/sulfonate/bicarbonate transport system substrate-binding protein
MLRQNGLDANRDVTILSLGVMPTIYAGLQNGIVDGAMLSPPVTFKAEEAGFRELVSLPKQDLVELQGAILVRDVLLQADPSLVEKFLRATIRGLIYYSTNRSGAAPILARNAKSSDELAGKIYDLVKPALTPEGILNDDLQKRVMAPLLERVGRKDMAVGRFFDFALARKINGELKAEGWRP